jgi:hypothetical protein
MNGRNSPRVRRQEAGEEVWGKWPDKNPEREGNKWPDKLMEMSRWWEGVNWPGTTMVGARRGVYVFFLLRADLLTGAFERGALG